MHLMILSPNEGRKKKNVCHWRWMKIFSLPIIFMLKYLWAKHKHPGNLLKEIIRRNKCSTFPFRSRSNIKFNNNEDVFNAKMKYETKRYRYMHSCLRLHRFKWLNLNGIHRRAKIIYVEKKCARIYANDY